MSAVFISYRRNDSSGHTGRLYDHLCEKFGQDVIFRDIDTIEPGTDFVEAVENNIKDCAALIVVIGTEWLTAEDEMGRRLDDPNDFVRIEVASALKKNIRVIPVLVKGATMPAGSNLPDDLAALSRRHALEISDSRWEYDMGRLITTLSSIIEEDEPVKIPLPPDDKKPAALTEPAPEKSATEITSEKIQKQPESKKAGSNGLLISVVAAIVLAGILVWQFLPKKQPSENVETTAEIVEEKTIEEVSDRTVEAVAVPEQAERERDERVIELLSAAENDLAALRLTSPSGNNAFEKYNLILEQDPEHEAARDGIRSIADKYIGMSENALSKEDIQGAEKFLAKAVSVYPQVEGITQLEISIQQSYEAQKNQQAQREAELQRQQDARNAAKAREQAEKEALIAREIEAKNQALIARERTESCLKQCEGDYRRCQSESKAPDSRECESNAKKACNKVQDACLGDPQTALLWGDLGAESECLGRYSQCMRKQANECRNISSGKSPACDSDFANCKRQCQ